MLNFSNQINIYVNIKLLLVLGFGFILSFLQTNFLIALLIVLFFWSFRGTKYSLQALILLTLISSLNPALFEITIDITIFRWIVFVVSCLLIIKREFSKNINLPEIRSFLIFALIVVLLTLISSHAKTISIFKISIFTIGSIAVILGFKSQYKNGDYWLNWLISFYLFLILISIPTYFIPQIGFNRNATGFQGITSHPQLFAIFLTPFTTLLGMFLLLTRINKSLLVYFLFVLSSLFLVLSQSRTGLFATILSALIILIIYLFSKKNYSTKLHTGSVVIVSIVLLFILLVPSISDSIFDFMVKGKGINSISQSLILSRSYLIEKSLINFGKNPILGIGFGVPSEYRFNEIIKVPVLGVPISASVEKGFLPSAILEEIGIVGTVSFLIIILIFIKGYFKPNIRLLPFSIFLACIFSNLGESILFSYGGLGLLLWIWIGFSQIYKIQIYSKQK